MEGQDRFTVVLLRIYHTERNICITGFPEIETGTIVFRSLIGPAAFSVTGGRIGESHIRRTGKVDTQLRRLYCQIAESRSPARSQHSKIDGHKTVFRNPEHTRIPLPLFCSLHVGDSRIKALSVLVECEHALGPGKPGPRQKGDIFQHDLRGEADWFPGILRKTHLSPESQKPFLLPVLLGWTHFYESLLQRNSRNFLLPFPESLFCFQRNPSCQTGKCTQEENPCCSGCPMKHIQPSFSL